MELLLSARGRRTKAIGVGTGAFLIARSVEFPSCLTLEMRNDDVGLGKPNPGPVLKVQEEAWV